MKQLRLKYNIRLRIRWLTIRNVKCDENKIGVVCDSPETEKVYFRFFSLQEETGYIHEELCRNGLTRVI